MLERGIFNSSRAPMFGTDKQPTLPQPLVTSKFGKVRARIKLLRDYNTLHSFIGVHGDAGDKGLNVDPTMGCDPELFLADKDGTLLPAFDVLASKETNPEIFWDGFQAEFTARPYKCLASLGSVIHNQLNRLQSAMNVVRPGVQILATDVVEVPKAVMNRVSNRHAALGCDPSHNLYGMTTEIPVDARTLPYRFAGGHIHFGDPAIAADPEYAGQVVANLDKVLAIWSVGVAANYEKTKIRRRYYGLAGEFRLPKHGLEYRTLSNFWLRHPAIYNITFEIARVVMRATSYGLLDFWQADQRTVVDVINNYDVEMARRIMRVNEKLFVSLLSAANNEWAKVTFATDWDTGKVKETGRRDPKLCAQRALQLSLEGMESLGDRWMGHNIFDSWNGGNVPWMSVVSPNQRSAHSVSPVRS